MQTRCLTVDPNQPEPAAIEAAAAVIRAGGLVAFPTETVYGLGASALDPAAVARIFAAKGRPPTNPLIVHVDSAAAARRLVTQWPDAAARLAVAFWPGPLSLVLPKQPLVPDIVTAGGSTVAVRVPAHPVALALLRAAGLPVAAPSANPSQRVSATTAEHVLRWLGGKLDLVLDGGPTPGGIESTVVDAGIRPPRLLRPGMLSAADLNAVLDDGVVTGQGPAGGPIRSPGLTEKHYAPRVPVYLTPDDGRDRIAQLRAVGIRPGWMPLATSPLTDSGDINMVPMPPAPAEYARRLYAVLHALEDAGVGAIVIQLPPRDEPWQAIHDRLRRAAAA